MSNLKKYEVTTPSGYLSTLKLSDADAKAKGLLGRELKPGEKRPLRKAARAPRNKQAPAPANKAALQPQGGQEQPKDDQGEQEGQEQPKGPENPGPAK